MPFQTYETEKAILEFKPFPTAVSGSTVAIEDPQIPADFYEALSDVEGGRVVDLDIALEEKPPE